MECKSGLHEAGGNEEAAVERLRKKGKKTQETRLGRETSAGRIGVYTDVDKKVGAMVEFLARAHRWPPAPIANSPPTWPSNWRWAGATTPEELLKLPSPSKPGQTLGEQKDDMFNRIREVFNMARSSAIDGRAAAMPTRRAAPGLW